MPDFRAGALVITTPRARAFLSKHTAGLGESCGRRVETGQERGVRGEEEPEAWACG